jgi:hypothetical protein
MRGPERPLTGFAQQIPTLGVQFGRVEGAAQMQGALVCG